MSDRLGVRGRVLLPWHAIVAAAVLSLAIGAMLHEGVNGGRPAVESAARSQGFSHKGLLTLPLAAQGPVSAALGADSAAYRVGASQHGVTAANPAQRLNSSFTSSGISVNSGATRVGLSLLGVGYGSSLRMLDGVAPRAHGNRVLYQRPGLSEWYENGPLGLEQGFTVVRAPAGHAAGPLTLSLALTGNAHPSLATDAQSVALSRAGKGVLRYDGLSATDARGQRLHSWLEIEGGRLLLRVDANGARYPLRIDPFIQQGEKLPGTGANPGGFGSSVALSADGDTALIGGEEDENSAGAALVFTRSGETWTQQGGKLTGSDQSPKADFGDSVALSADGNTALIGGQGNNGDVGAAWVFTRSGETWTQQGEKLTGGCCRFGSSVALSFDGNTALIGTPSEKEGSIGAALVFARTGSTWAQQARLTGNGETTGGQFGDSVALSSDGNTAVIGAPTDGPLKDVTGAAWVFTRSGESWTQEGSKRTGSGGFNDDLFGESVALSGDGNTALLSSSSYGAEVFANETLNPPEIGTCLKTIQFAGDYPSVACLAQMAEGNHEWLPGARRSKFTTATKEGIVTLESVHGSKVVCKAETGAGEYTGHKTIGDVLLTFTGCERLGEECSSTGAAAGEVRTDALEGVLGVEKVGETAVKNKLALDLFPVGNSGPFMEFSCGATEVSMRGSLIVPVKANKMELAPKLTFSATKGKQKPESLAGDPKDVLEVSYDKGAFEQIGLTAKITQTNEEAIEFNSAF